MCADVLCSLYNLACGFTVRDDVTVIVLIFSATSFALDLHAHSRLAICSRVHAANADTYVVALSADSDDSDAARSVAQHAEHHHYPRTEFAEVWLWRDVMTTGYNAWLRRRFEW